jgi:hypothetical protein
VAAMFHGQYVRLISPRVITFYGGTSKVEFSSLNLAKLKQSTKEEIAAIPEHMIRRVMENLGVRQKQDMVGGVSDVLFKTK